jgi:hypothetical protein
MTKASQTTATPHTVRDPRATLLAALALIVALAALVIGVIGREAPTVRAERFVLVDADGNEWARLGWSDDGQGPGLFLADPTGQAVLSFVEASDGRTYPSLLMMDANRDVRLSVAVAPEGAWLDLMDEQGQKRLSVAQQADGPLIEGRAADGTVTFQVP